MTPISIHTGWPQRLLQLPSWLACLLALVAGAITPLSLAPIDLWPLAILGLIALALLVWRQPGSAALLRSFCFGLGFFGMGTSWVFVSIYYYGGAPIPLAILLTFVFVAFLALVFSLPFYALGRWWSQSSLALLLAFPLLWLLGEWLRSWLLTGFPWLYLGYGHLDTWLAGWAPVAGVYGSGLVVLLTAGFLAQLALRAEWKPLLPWGLLVAALWLGGLGLRQVHWTQVDEQPLQVALVQPDIAQDIKWQDYYAQPTLELLLDLSEDHWDKDWIIWPEAAVPLTYHQALPFLNRINQKASDTGTGLITGIIYDDRRDLREDRNTRYYNSLAGFGEGLGIYHKRRLVPFGEYVPLENWLRGLIEFFNLPTSIISLGPQQQGGLKVGQVSIAPAICYELAYPELMARSAREAQVLLNVSNLGWFGDSMGPPQFLQMGRMRALETGRYLVYSTNNGVSALIDHQGRIRAQTRAFTAESLAGSIYPAQGLTPFMHWGAWPLVLLAALGLGISLRQKSR